MHALGRWCALALVAVLVVGACGGGGDDRPADDSARRDVGAPADVDGPADADPTSTTTTSTTTTTTTTTTALDGPAPGADYVDRATEAIVGVSSLDADVARCIATAFLDAAGGAAALRAVGLGPDTWMDAPDSFADLGLPSDDETLDRLTVDLGGCADGYELLVGSAAPGPDADVRRCVAEELDEAEVRRQLARSSLRGAAVEAGEVDVFDVLAACGDRTIPG